MEPGDKVRATTDFWFGLMDRRHTVRTGTAGEIRAVHPSNNISGDTIYEVIFEGTDGDFVKILGSSGIISPLVVAIDAEHLARQRAWSTETFGPGDRLRGVIDHIRKELAEIEAEPPETRHKEWVDVVILALDGLWRSVPPDTDTQYLIDEIVGKQERNYRRQWPDWREADPDRAIEHVRGEEDHG